MLQEFINNINSVVNSVNGVLYEPYVLPLILLLAGFYFTFKTNFLQLRLFKESLRVVSEKPVNLGSTSSFGALMLSTASRVGTGNIMGVSTALCLGGPGAIFWMWMTAILGGATAFVESTLAQIYKKRNSDGSSYGGPSYYMQDALGQRWLGVIFSIVLILTYVVGYNMLAAYNTQDTFSVFKFYNLSTRYIIGAVLAFLFAICVLGGGKRLTKVTEVLVPLMGVMYVIVSLVVVIMNINLLPDVFVKIFSSAFDFKAIFGGFTGSCVMFGIKRGLYSNEAGMGSAPNAAAAADVSHPVKQGLVQMLSVFIDTLLICSATAFMCLFSGVEPSASAAGAAYVQTATRVALGDFGPIFVAVAVCLFAFTTLLGNYYYTEGCLRFIMKKDPSKFFMTCFRIFAIILVFLGAIVSAGLAWDTADLLQALMVIINVPVIVILTKPAMLALKDYEEQKKLNKNPSYNARNNGIEKTDFWTK